MKILEMEQKIEKSFSVFKIIAFESEVANSHNLEQDLRSHIFIRKILS